MHIFCITNSMDTSLGKLWEVVTDSEDSCAQSMALAMSQTQLGN